MRRLAVGLVILLLLASCTDDPTVDEPPAASSTSSEAAATPEPSPTPVSPAPPSAPDEPEAEAQPESEAQAEPEAEAEPAGENDGLFPTVVDVSASPNDGGSWRFNVTLLSEYDTPQRYADAWRVLDANDNELGIRVLGHDHANEQPFTRSHTIEVPAGVTTVFVEGRDQLNGWSGERFEYTLQP